MDCNFLLNVDNLIEIDVTPSAATSTWARLAKGINNITPNNNEDVDQQKYLDGEGHGESEVTGMQRTLVLAGHRAYGDTAQDYIFSKSEEIGCERKTNVRHTYPNGKVVEKGCTIANITEPNGDAAAKGAISFEIHYNGKPTVTQPSTAATLSVTWAGGSVSGSTSFTATPDAGNSLAYKVYDADPGAQTGNIVPRGLTAYTSGDDILNVTAGQFVAAFELSEYGRTVKAVVYELQAIDITT